MLRAPLIRREVVPMCEPREKRLLATTGMMEAFHHEQFPLDGVVGLIQQGAGQGQTRIFKHGIPPRFLILKPLLYALAIGRSSHEGDVVRKAAQPLAQRKHPQALALARPGPQGVEL
jgi:hypothetical protein